MTFDMDATLLFELPSNEEEGSEEETSPPEAREVDLTCREDIPSETTCSEDSTAPKHDLFNIIDFDGSDALFEGFFSAKQQQVQYQAPNGTLRKKFTSTT